MDDDGWTLVTSQRSRKQNLPKPVKVPISAKMIGWQCKAPKPKMPLIKIGSSKHKNLTWRRSRRLVTLNEYMPIQFRNEDLLPMTCYNIDGDEEFKDEDNIDIVTI